jgi:hypothetical protein
MIALPYVSLLYVYVSQYYDLAYGRSRSRVYELV